MDGKRFEELSRRIIAARNRDGISDSEGQELVAYSDRLASAWGQLTYLVPRLFPELEVDATEEEAWHLICGHCAFHHGMTVEQVHRTEFIKLVALLAGDLRRQQSSAMEPAISIADRKENDREATKVSLDAQALALFVEHRDWTKARIAKELGCRPQSLAPKRCPKLDAAFRAAMSPRDPGRRQARGAKDIDGNLEAWEE